MTELDTLTWNVRYLGHRAGGLRATRANLHAVADALAERRAHVLSLQEVESSSLRAGFGAHQHTALVDALHAALEARGSTRGYVPYYFPAHRYGVSAATLYTTGLMVLVRDDLEVEHTHHVDVTHRRIRWLGPLKQTRVCAHVRLRTPSGARLDLFNTHLSLPAFFSANVLRFQKRMGWGANQLAEIEAVLAYIDAARTGPVVLVGDFNSLPGSPVYERIVTSTDLVDGFADHLGLDVDGARAWHTAGALGGRMALDHVFSTPDVRWLSFDGTHPFGVQGSFDGLSDHVPKVGRLAL